MELLELKNLEVNKAGYLVSKLTKKPVTHAKFVEQQKQAEYIVKLSIAIMDKTFTCGKVDNLAEIKAAVLTAINSKNTKEYVAVPAKPKSKANDELVQFALDFVNYEESKAQVENINKLMAEFDVIDAVENVGDYFEQGLCKLNEIYDIKTILAAVQINAEKLK